MTEVIPYEKLLSEYELYGYKNVPDMLESKSGMKALIEQEKRRVSALTNPAKVAEDRIKELEKASGKYILKYVDTLQDLIKQGISKEDAQRIAEQAAEADKKTALALVEAKYPADFRKLVTGGQLAISELQQIQKFGGGTVFSAPPVSKTRKTRKTRKPKVKNIEKVVQKAITKAVKTSKPKYKKKGKKRKTRSDKGKKRK